MLRHSLIQLGKKLCQNSAKNLGGFCQKHFKLNCSSPRHLHVSPKLLVNVENIFQPKASPPDRDATVEDRQYVQEMFYNNLDTGGLSASDYLNNLNEEDIKKLKVMKLEYEVALASGEHVPEEMTDEDWLKAWSCSGRNQRRKLYRYLAKTNRAKAKEKNLKEEKRLKEEERLKQKISEQREEAGGSHVYRGVVKNTFILRLQDPTINKVQARRIYESLLFGEKIIFDMSYDDLMRPFDVTNTVDQILEAHGVNKRYPEPFYIYFCNAKPDGHFVRRLDRSTNGMYLEYPFTVTEKSYLDLFAKEELVYLTPNARDYMTVYDPNKTYIIGGLVDKVVTKPVTMAKAKREGIQMAKLPLDLHMRFIMGNKSLCLNQILGIMCEMKKTGSWREAFKYVPRRKAVFLEEVDEFERRSQKQQNLKSRRRLMQQDF